MLKAIMKETITVKEVSDDIYAQESVFEKGMEVEILKEVKQKYGYKQFVIYSEELNESTVVYDGLLSNVDLHLQ